MATPRTTKGRRELFQNRQWVRVFALDEGKDSCNCPELLCKVQATAPTITRNAPTDVREWSCTDGRYVTFRRVAGDIQPVTLDLRSPAYINRGVLFDWIMSGCPKTLVLVFGTCEREADFAQAAGYAVMKNVLPVSMTQDTFIGAETNDDLGNILYQTLSVQADGQSYNQFALPEFSEYSLDGIVTGIRDIQVAEDYSDCSDSANCRKCNHTYILDTDATGNGLIHALNCGTCEDCHITRTIPYPVISMTATSQGLMILVETTETTGVATEQVTKWGLLPYDCVCDTDIEFTLMSDPVMTGFANAAGVSGDYAYIVGDAGANTIVDTVSGEIYVQPAIDFPSNWTGVAVNGDVVAAYGVAGQLAVATSGDALSIVATPVTTEITGVHLIDEICMFIHTADGETWLTQDGGDSWSQNKRPSVNVLSTIVETASPDNNTSYLVGQNGTYASVVATYDTFCHATTLPRGKTSKLKLTTVTAVASCSHRPDMVWVGGDNNGTPILYYGDGS